MSTPEWKSDAAALMRAVAEVIKPILQSHKAHLARLERRTDSADALIDDLDRRLAIAEARLRALDERAP